MIQLPVGRFQRMEVKEKTEHGYLLSKGIVEALLPFEHVENIEIVMHTSLDVFLYQNKKKQLLASLQKPNVLIDQYDWVEVVEAIPNLGAFVEIGIEEEVLVSKDDLPLFTSVWPQQGDQLYVTLTTDKKNRLLAKPATEKMFNDLFHFAEDLELNEQISGRVIRVDREGTVVVTDDQYRGFIHHSERDREPRLGEYVKGRIIEVKEDGTLNISLKPMKHERIDTDAEKILQYLKDHQGVMPFHDKSDPDDIKQTFQMSKSAFKRALGRLMKDKRIEQRDDKTTLLS